MSAALPAAASPTAITKPREFNPWLIAFAVVVPRLFGALERNREFVPNYLGTQSQWGKDRFRFRRVGNQSK
jgi:hypothetical protein